MKRIINTYLISILFLLLQTSCQEDWLEPKPLSFYAPINVYVDEAGFRALLTTMRRDLKKEFYNADHWMVNQHKATDLAVFHYYLTDAAAQLTPTSSSSLGKWIQTFIDMYGHVKNCNVLITRIDDIEWKDQQVKNGILAEGLFYRSYWYYRLVHTYGDVPWTGEEVTDAKLDYYTTNRWAIIDKIQSDMEFAVQWLPEQAPIGFVTKYAGLHLLTKIYLANTEFDKAITSSSEIINGPFSLMTERFGSWKNDNRRNVLWDLHRVENKNLPENKEAIFTTVDRYEAPDAARDPSGHNASWNYVAHYWTFPDETGTRGFNSGDLTDTLGIGSLIPLFNYFQSHGIWREFGYTWETTPDIRRADINWIDVPDELLINIPTSPNYGQPVNLKWLASLEDTSYMLRSWPYYKTFADIKYGKPNNRNFGGNGDWYVYRLAETYLLRAEAYFWKNQLNLAASDINVVRNRAKAILVSPSDVTIDFIFHERNRELHTEEPRQNEMVRVANVMARLNINGYSLDNLHQKNWWYDRTMMFNNWYTTPRFTFRGGAPAKISPHNMYWPIPQSVITANTKGVINQNLGYDGAENNISPLETIE